MSKRKLIALLASAALPSAPSGHRPGPDVLYAPPPRAPQLENAAPFRAPPILVSGATAYRDGEFLCPFAEFLGDHRVDLDPPHVTFGLVPRLQFARAGVVADHAYWVSSLTARDATSESSIDARSQGFALADPVPSALASSPGVLTGGRFGAMAYLDRRMTRAAAAPEPARDRLVVQARNVATASIDTRRAHLSCAPELAIDSDGPFDLELACSPPVPVGPGCASRAGVRLARVRGRRVVSLTARRHGATLERVRGRNLRRVVLRRPAHGAMRVRMQMRAGGHPRVSVTVVRRLAACPGGS